MQRRHNCSPAASFANCVMTLYLLEVHLHTLFSIPVTQRCQILSCDTLVANQRYDHLSVRRCDSDNMSCVFEELFTYRKKVCNKDRHFRVRSIKNLSVQHVISITYILTLRCRILLENLTGLQLVKKFPEFYGTRTFITSLTSASHLSLS